MATNSNPNYSFHIYSGVSALTGPGSYPVGSIIFEENLGSLCVVRDSSSTGLVRFANGIKGLTINKSGDVPTSVVFTLLGGSTETLDLSKFQTAAQVSSAITTALAAYVKTTDFNTYKDGIRTELDGVKDDVAANGNEISSLNGRMDDAESEIGSLDESLKNVYTKSEVYTKGETDNRIDNKIAALGKVFKIKEAVNTYGELPATGNENGDVRQVKTAGTDSNGDEFAANTEFYWDGTKWEILGINEVDMSDYVSKEDLTDINDALAGKLDRQDGAATTGNIVTWGDGGGKVVDSGKKISTSVNNNANEIPTSQAVVNKLADYMPKVESGAKGEILVRDANGFAEDSGVSIGQDMIEDDGNSQTIPTSYDVGQYVRNMMKWSTWPAN